MGESSCPGVAAAAPPPSGPVLPGYRALGTHRRWLRLAVCRRSVLLGSCCPRSSLPGPGQLPSAYLEPSASGLLRGLASCSARSETTRTRLCVSTRVAGAGNRARRYRSIDSRGGLPCRPFASLPDLPPPPPPLTSARLPPDTKKPPPPPRGHTQASGKQGPAPARGLPPLSARRPAPARRRQGALGAPPCCGGLRGVLAPAAPEWRGPVPRGPFVNWETWRGWLLDGGSSTPRGIARQR